MCELYQCFGRSFTSGSKLKATMYFSGYTFGQKVRTLRTLALNYDYKSAGNDLNDTSVVVVGMGASGRAAAKLALMRGAKSVTVLDKRTDLTPFEEMPEFQSLGQGRLRTELGPHSESTLSSTDVLVLSPGVPVNLPVVQKAAHSGVKLLSELAFASEVVPTTIPMAAISGTNGKSTVTSFTGQILEHSGISAFVGGNLGKPLSEAAMALLENPNNPPYQALVVEVSSYQMELPGNFHPKTAVILNLTPDHLERHGTVEKYALTKCSLFKQMGQSELAILPADCEILRRSAALSPSRATRAWLGAIPGVQLDSMSRRAIVVVPTTGLEAPLWLTGVAPPGAHNKRHAGTAALLALSLGLGVTAQQVQDAMGSLKGLPHRIEIVGTDSRAVMWLNDSKATNVESTAVALRAIPGRRAVVLLGGIAKEGVEKSGLGFSRLVENLKEQRGVVVFGQSGEAIEKELLEGGLSVPVVRTSGMISAMDLARSMAQSGDVVLLSPGCASFDEFRNFEHRGNVFREMAIIP